MNDGNISKCKVKKERENEDHEEFCVAIINCNGVTARVAKLKS